jgi:nitrile hydratase
MNGAHDLGGMHGFGRVAPEANEPVFHAEWERRVFALRLAMSAWGRWSIDMSRHASERMPPAEYLATSYYEHWLFGLETLLVECGFVTRDELAAGRPAAGERAVPVLTADLVPLALTRGDGFRMDADPAPRFAPGERVRARNVHPLGHTRLPRYARGRAGVVERDHGVFVFADASGDGLGRQPQRLYGVRFRARELWGEDAPARDSVHLDLFEAHLEPA